MTQELTIYGQPVPKGRPRVTMQGHAYTPDKTRVAEATIQRCAQIAHIRPMEGPLLVEVNFYFAIPKSWSKRARSDAMALRVLPAAKPDIDNCIKLVLDALNRIAWHDDTQVVGIVARKFYSDTPSTYIKIDTAL